MAANDATTPEVAVAVLSEAECLHRLSTQTAGRLVLNVSGIVSAVSTHTEADEDAFRLAVKDLENLATLRCAVGTTTSDFRPGP